MLTDKWEHIVAYCELKDYFFDYVNYKSIKVLGKNAYKHENASIK